MRKCLFVILVMISTIPLFSQEKKLLEKQLTDLLKDYANKFNNNRSKDIYTLKFKVSGTVDDNPFIMDGVKGPYVTCSLGFLKEKDDAQSWFDDWETMIGSLTLDGFKLKAQECESEARLKVLACKTWILDNSKNNVPAKYQTFAVSVKYVYTGSSYLGNLYIGGVK